MRTSRPPVWTRRCLLANEPRRLRGEEPRLERLLGRHSDCPHAATTGARSALLAGACLRP